MNEPTPDLLSSESDYRLFFDNAPDGVVVIDQYNRIQFWNPKAEAIFGWKSIDVIGKVLSIVIIPPNFRQAHDNGMKRYLTTGEVRVLNKTIEVPALHRSGHEFYISLTISKIDIKGITSFLAFVRDITEQRNNQLQLEQKTSELERINARLQEFAYIASHDLKEPLRKIAVFADMIHLSDGTILSPKAKTNLQKITDASIRMQSLIDGVLSYSSLGGRVAKESCSLEDLFQETLVSLENRIKETNALVSSDGLPEANVIPVQIQQLFQNLISNALKFSRRDVTPVVRVTHRFLLRPEVKGEYLQQAKRYLQLSIADNGIGFSMEWADKIFVMFKRLHSAQSYEGSGLGLAICRRIAENHGGVIGASSEEGVGTTFTIMLPYKT